MLSLLFVALAGNFPQDYQTFTAKDESFTVLFPGTPSERKNREGDGITWQVAAQMMVHQVTQGIKSEMPLSPGQKDELLIAVKDGIIKRVGAKMLVERKLQHDKNAAREYLFELPQEKGMLRVRCFVQGDRVWQVKVGGSKDLIGSDKATKFLDSLKVK